MKNIILIFALLLVNLFAKAQKEVSVAFNDVATGNNISLKYGLYLSPKNQVEFGVKYHLNPSGNNLRNNTFYKNIHTQNEWQNWGLEGSFYRDVTPENFKIRLRLLYNVQYTYAGVALKSELSPPAHFIENNIGLNLKAPITEKMFMNVSAGGGVLLVRDYQNNGFSENTWELSRFLSFGISYQIK